MLIFFNLLTDKRYNHEIRVITVLQHDVYVAVGVTYHCHFSGAHLSTFINSYIKLKYFLHVPFKLTAYNFAT